MAHRLIFTLGRGTREKESNRYRAAQYQFPNAWCSPKTSVFGLALHRWLGTQGDPPTHLHVLGTRRSIWDALLEDATFARSEETTIPILDALHAAAGDPGRLRDALETLTGTLTAQFGLPVDATVIPEGLSHEEHLQILISLDRLVQPGDTVSICVTHGLRHLPLLQLLSLFQLVESKEIKIAGIYYGALELTEPTSGLTPVVNLTAALDVIAWTQAMHHLRATARFSAVVPLLASSGDGLTDDLRNLDHSLDTGQTHLARRPAQSAANSLHAGLPQAGHLFLQRLESSLAWSSAGQFHARQLKLARGFLEAGDHLRAAITGWEAFVSFRVNLQRGDPQNYQHREAAKSALRDGWLPSPLLQLNLLRNAMAHGSRPSDGRVQTALSDATALHSVVSTALDEIERQFRAQQ